MAVVLFAAPLIGAYNSTKDIARQALQYRKAGELIVTFRFFKHTLYYYTDYQIANEFSAPESLASYAQKHHGILVVTDLGGWKTLLKEVRLPITLLGKEGKSCLLRVGSGQ
jgi:hypothetical protein